MASPGHSPSMGGPAGRGSSESGSTLPTRPSTAVVNVTAPVVEKTSFASLRKFDVMAKFLHQRIVQSKWLEEYHENMYFGTANLGTFVRRPDGTYARTTQNEGVLKAVERVAPIVAFTMSCDSVSVLLDGLTPDQRMVNFMDGSSISIFPSVTDVKDFGAYANMGYFTALCKREHFILVCAGSPSDLLVQAASLDGHLVAMIWGTAVISPPPMAFDPASAMGVPRSNSMPQMQQQHDFSTFSFGDQPNLNFTAGPAPQQQQIQQQPPSQPMYMQRRGSAYQQPMYQQPQQSMYQQPQQSMYQQPRHVRSVSAPRFTQPFQTEEEEEDQFAPHMAMPPPIRRSSMAAPPRRASVARRPSTGKGRVSFQEHEQTPRSNSMSAIPRNVSISSVPEDELPDLPDMPVFARRPSMQPKARNGSFSSTYLGNYRGSVSNDVASKVMFVERAMEVEEAGEVDVERQRDQKRPFALVHSCLVAVACAFVVTISLWSLSTLISETRLDGGWLRWSLIVTIPFFAIFSLFFAIVISGSFFQLFGPLSFLQQNTQFYSAKPPKLEEHSGEDLPHMTIQMPVYKEGLKGVIMPTIISVLKAVNYYQAHGGTATILVCDDGMQLISEELQEARKVFYELHDIAWVSRPKQVTKPGPDYFLRKGKFKKASNMNYALDFSGRVEDRWLAKMEAKAKELGCAPQEISLEDEDDIYESARVEVEAEDGGRTWSAGDVRIGEFILIIDSDTRVPENCLLCGALELMESPEVAIVQHSSGVMRMTDNMFESGITYFTNLIYTSIRHAVGSGDVAPFVGHNAFLRWRAIQSIAFQEDGRTKFWSESHVSEDFEVALRLQQSGFIVRMAAYHGEEFKEGVSLTVYDELARWEKYAYGCNELIFHPLIYWPVRGPLTPLFRAFLCSNIKITSKFTIIAYIGTYYAIAVGFPLSIVNYVICGLQFQLDHYYQTSWHIFVGLCVVYNVLSPISFAMLRYRMGQCSYFSALGDCIKWMPLFLLFFGGLSYHLCKALSCHFFSIQIEWTTTAKELEKTGFKIGLDRVFRDFWRMYVIILPLCAGMVYFGAYAPGGWRITDFTVIVPLANQLGCHALLPFALGLF